MLFKLDICSQARRIGSQHFIALVLLAVTASVQASEDYWQAPDASARGPNLSAHRYLLDEVVLRARLAQAPHEVFGDRSLTVMLPMPDGSLARFAAMESPIMEPGLAVDFPDFKSYKVYGIDDPTATGRLSMSPLGFRGTLHTAQGRVMIDPDRIAGGYVMRSRRDAANDDFSCGVYDIDQSQRPQHSPVASRAASRVTGMLLQYRIAVSATQEYAAAVAGGNVTNTQIEIGNAIDRVNEIYERDTGIRLMLVAGNQNLIEVGGNAGFSNSDAFAMFDQNQAWIDAVIGNGNYDIGHVFSTGGGGLAFLGSTCDNANKAKGVTGQSNPMGDPFYIDFVAHEIGHQFNADHSFNGTTFSCGGGNRWGPTAVEPGSGTTVMAYAGICGAENLQNNSDATFHAVSIRQIDAFANDLIGTCGAEINTEPMIGNVDPTIMPVPDYTIPIGTPFALDAVANDDDIPGDPAQSLTYQWDQINAGGFSGSTNSFTFGTDNSLNPLFRSYLPQAESRRDFPALGTQIPEGQYDNAEVIPCTDRTLDFRLTVRDQVSGQAIENVRVTTTNQAGPFAITNFNSSTTVDPTAVNTLTWSVANTTGAAVGCTNVDIDLLAFSDGGYTRYSVHNLMSNVLNNGSQQIIFPDTTLDAQIARFRVSCRNNVFYDISDANLFINGTTTNEYTDMDFATFFNTGLTTGVPEPTCGSNPGVLEFSSASYSGVEDSNIASITVTRTGGNDGSVSVQYATSDGSATSGSDYSATSGTLIFNDGVNSQFFDVTLIDDVLLESDETINIALTNVTGASIGAQDTAVLTILDNEVPQPGVLQFSSATYNAPENDGFVSVTALRTGGSDGAVSVQYATSDGTATVGTDYTATNGTLNFADGVTTQNFIIPVIDDALVEANETVNLILSSPVGSTIGAQGSAILLILDNDVSNDNSQSDNSDSKSSGGGSFTPVWLLIFIVLRQLHYRLQRHLA